MIAASTQTSALAALGALLEYPDDRFQERYDEALLVADALGGEAAAAIAEFSGDVTDLSTELAQELYTRSFDLSPVCVPYASVHLFGEESFKRAELMTGLIAAYERVGFDRGAELPDHIALLLQCAPQFDPDEWADLSALVLSPVIDKMCAALEKAGSPWRHIMQAAGILLTLGDERDGY